jgi:hypothetical protein
LPARKDRINGGPWGEGEGTKTCAAPREPRLGADRFANDATVAHGFDPPWHMSRTKGSALTCTPEPSQTQSSTPPIDLERLYVYISFENVFIGWFLAV